MSVFYISRQGKQEGPHSLQVIASKISSGYLRRDDFVYDPSAKDWKALHEFSLTKNLCKIPGIDTDSGQEAWYLLRGDHQLGPYSYGEIMDLLQQKKAFDHDYVWKASMSAWEKISETEYFHPDFVARYNKKHGVHQNVNFRRKNPRVDFKASLIIHNQKKLWNAESFEVSASGASIEVPRDSFFKGDILVLHYRPTLEAPAFNVHCEIVNIQEVDGQKPSRIRLGLRFIKVNHLAQRTLNQLIQRKAA